MPQIHPEVHDNGHIYKGSYEGWYCEGCESFKTEKELEDGKCPITKTPPVRRSEPCYFFAWSKFQDRLLALYDEHPEFIEPRADATRSFSLRRGRLQDVNVTRAGETWGIRVPFDEQFTIYVWFDAVLNYVTAIGYGTDQANFEKWWPADMHFIGKDITRFHCAFVAGDAHGRGRARAETGFRPRFRQPQQGKDGQNARQHRRADGNHPALRQRPFRYYFLARVPLPVRRRV